VRYVLVLLGLLAVVGVLAGIKAKQIGSLIAMGKEMEKAGAPPTTVGSAVAQEQAWEGSINAVGSVVAAKGVAVSTDAAGVVSRILFESGANVRQGQVLVELDASVERAQLASARARRELAESTVKRSRALLETGAIARQQVDAEESALRTATTDHDALQAQIEKKSAKAPFTGKVGLRLVNLGQFLSPGANIATLEAIDIVYVDFTLPQQRLADIKIGMPVRISLGADAGTSLDATVAALEGGVDAVTRTLKIRASVPNKDETLRPGMFVRVSVVLPERAKFVTVPATAIVHASYGDSIFVVEEKKAENGKPASKIARQQFVRTGESRGDFVAVLDGVSAGQEVVTAGAFKLRNGGGVVINNSVKQDARLDPAVENR